MNKLNAFNFKITFPEIRYIHFAFTYLQFNVVTVITNKEILEPGTLNLAYRYSTRVYPKVSGLSHNEIYAYNKHSLRSNTKDYGGETH
jgi:hypothetical protein